MVKTGSLLEGSIPRAILILSVPVMATMFLETAFIFLNGIFVGRVGTEALAAVNASNFFIWLLYGVFATISAGTTSLVAQYVGAGREREARLYPGAGIVGCLALSVALSALGLLLCAPVLDLMGLSPGVAAIGRTYLSILLFGAPLFAFEEIVGAVLRGYGNTRTPMWVTTLATVTNLVLAPPLILGSRCFPASWHVPWIFSGLGAPGAGLATAVAWLIPPMLYAMYFRRGSLQFKPDLGILRWDLERLQEIVRIGLPPSFQSVIFSLTYMALTRILSVFGTEAVAAVGIGHRVESICYLICVSFAIASTTLVGQNKGAGNLDRASRSAWTAAAMACSVSTIIGLVFFFQAGALAAVFSNDPRVVEIATWYLRWQAVTEPLMALAIVMDGSFTGTGDTMPSMVISIPFTLLRLPLSYLFAIHFGLGVAAVWAVISVLVGIRGILIALWFRLGRWKGKVTMRPDQAAPNAA